MNIWERVQLAKVYYQSGIFSKREYIVALGHLFNQATALREGK
ncbi:hypothetical protein [Arthrobacter sp. 9MFCol3.1]|jgi:hypothetical protein|nr:hypothetical protein [Arthrobacter sp. 9MFCol3.1]